MTDVVVIGAGHNGLTAAAYLARAGKRVLVVEKRDAVGGLAGTYEFAPGFRATFGPDFAGLMSSDVIGDLGLKVHGLEIVALDPIVRTRDGFSLWRDVSRSVAEIRKRSPKDADAYPRFLELVEKLSGFLKPLLAKPAPTPDIRGGADLVEILRLGWGFRQLGARTMHELLRILPMSLSDFLDEWFDDEVLKAALAGPGLEGVCLGPKSAGTAALFLYQRLGRNPALARNLTPALAGAARGHGVDVRTGVGVAEILVAEGRAHGVALEDGQKIEAGAVLSTVSPRRTFRELMDPAWLPPSFVSEVDHIRYRGVTAKLNLALDRLPEGEAHDGVLQVGSSLDDLERAYDAAKYGRASDEPFLRAVIPTRVDPGLAPDGKHVMSVLVQYVPSGASFSAETAIGALGVEDLLLHHHVMTPSDYERELGLPEGSFHHGEMALDQLFFMRPVPGWSQYRTPIESLFLGGPGAHPGGGISGAPGAHAAREIVKSRG